MSTPPDPDEDDDRGDEPKEEGGPPPGYEGILTAEKVEALIQKRIG